MKVKTSKTKEELDFVPVFMIGFTEEFDTGVVMLLPAHEMMVEEEPDFALFSIDSAIDMLMQRRDKLQKREIH